MSDGTQSGMVMEASRCTFEIVQSKFLLLFLMISLNAPRPFDQTNKGPERYRGRKV